MKLFFATFFLTISLVVEAQDEPCLDWTAGFDLNGCTYDRIFDLVEEELGNCPHDVLTELRLVTSTTSDEAALETIDAICFDGWNTASQTTFSHIDPRFTDEFMAQYIKGEGFLNRKYEIAFKIAVCAHGKSY